MSTDPQTTPDSSPNQIPNQIAEGLLRSSGDGRSVERIPLPPTEPSVTPNPTVQHQPTAPKPPQPMEITARPAPSEHRPPPAKTVDLKPPSKPRELKAPSASAPKAASKTPPQLDAPKNEQAEKAKKPEKKHEGDRLGKGWGEASDWKAESGKKREANPWPARILAGLFCLAALGFLASRLVGSKSPPLPLNNFVLPELGAPEDGVSPDGPFADGRLAIPVRKALNLDKTAPIRPNDLTGITSLDASGLGIRTLLGIETLTRLETLNLSGNDFTSLRPLRYLPNLKDLDIRETPFSCTGQAISLKKLAEQGTRVKSDCD